MDALHQYLTVVLAAIAAWLAHGWWKRPQPKGKRYGWIPDLPDHRDRLYTVPPRSAPLPPAVDLSVHCPPVYDQGQLGSCTANAIGALLQFDEIKQGKNPSPAPSRLFIYYNERSMEGTVNEDAGAMIRDGIQTLTKWGFCPESVWPYNIARFTKKPCKQAYASAVKERVQSYARLDQTPDQLKGCLAQGFPFVFGFTVFESFESQAVAQTGMMPMPGPNEQQLGGHAVCCVGYDDSKQCYLVRNSWSDKWGAKGYFWMPYAFMHNAHLCDDFWTVKFIP